MNAEQQVAVETILQSVQEQQSQTYLLEGITGSGKTEVYLQVIAEVLNQGKTAIMLVPEISLTPQMVQRFKSRFGEHVAVMHSGLSQGENTMSGGRLNEEKRKWWLARVQPFCANRKHRRDHC